MDYIELIVQLDPYDQQTGEIIIAQLAEMGFDSFSVNDNGINAYIKESLLAEEEIIGLLEGLFIPDTVNFNYTINRIPDQNWNILWESNFDPIIVDNRCLVRASFHKNTPKLDYEIIIDPKMAFGTGHHQTTHLMIDEMLYEDFTNKEVLDMGCGTGVLAILAEMRGAKKITAIDIDEWAFQSTIENTSLNGCKNIEVLMGDVKAIGNRKFDIILANINLNILLSDLKNYKDSLQNKGTILISGILNKDINSIERKANELSLKVDQTHNRDEWVMMVLKN